MGSAVAGVRAAAAQSRIGVAVCQLPLAVPSRYSVLPPLPGADLQKFAACRLPAMLARAAFRASAEVSWAGDRSCRLRAAWLCEGIGAAQRVGQPVQVGHVPDQVRRVGRGHPGTSDDQAPRGSPCGTWTWLPRSSGCRTRRAHARPGRVGRRVRRPPAGPALRSAHAGPSAAAGSRAGRTRPAGRAAPT
jgi:hypothetical protein